MSGLLTSRGRRARPTALAAYLRLAGLLMEPIGGGVRERMAQLLSNAGAVVGALGAEGEFTACLAALRPDLRPGGHS
ncbi:hypothetical protein GCM10023083_44090 [Streptomyces phyllanthi]